MSTPPREFEGREVTVMGLGLYGGGAAVTRFLARRGARVTVTDLRTERELESSLQQLRGIEARFVLGEHREQDFGAADMIVVNPAVPPTSRFLDIARAAKVRLTSEVALFLERTPARVAAITGTQGKSSTTNYLAQLLGAAHPERRVFLGGNIGHSLLDDLEQMTSADLCALELSSYQLEFLPDELQRARADSPIEVAVLTNVLSDHLERHGTRGAYGLSKLRILELLAPGGLALLPDHAAEFGVEIPKDVRAVQHPGARFERLDVGYLLDGEWLASRDHDERFVSFQRDNLHLALAAARGMGAEPAALDSAVAGLRGLPHRLDLVGRLGARRLWDNGISTAPDSTISALENLPRAATLMVGGQVKDIDLQPLLECVRERAARVVVFGAARETWAARFRELGLEVREADGPREALHQALELGAGELLFSPACSSFDAYPNVIARAQDMLDAARELGLETLEGVTS